MRRAKISQREIALRLHVTQPTVSSVLARTAGAASDAMTEAIWNEIERLLVEREERSA